jgi:ketosteroid isomerase-like protein
MAHPDEELVRSAFDAFAKGDVDTLRESMAQDAVWHVPGRNQLSGEHRGVDAILGFFAKTMELSGGTFRVIHIRDGKLTETWLLSENQYAADEFFS